MILIVILFKVVFNVILLYCNFADIFDIFDLKWIKLCFQGDNKSIQKIECSI